MGSLRQRSEGVWQARVYSGLDPLSGKRRYAARTIHARTEEEAARELRKLEKSVAAGKHPKGTTAVTLGEQLHDYLAMKLPRLSPGSRPSYRAAVEIGAKPLHGVPLGKLTARDLDSLYASLETEGKEPCAGGTSTSTEGPWRSRHRCPSMAPRRTRRRTKLGRSRSTRRRSMCCERTTSGRASSPKPAGRCSVVSASCSRPARAAIARGR